MDMLADFVGRGLRTGDAAVIIAMPSHRRELVKRLTAMGLAIAAAEAEDRFICLDAEDTLSSFMVDGWPDEELFAAVIRGILARARKGGRKVRAFGEMVALLWARGQCGATVRLEHLWHEMCERDSFALFCAYPKSGFTESPAQSIAQVCALHSKVLAA
jgi:hypothetical protein